MKSFFNMLLCTASALVFWQCSTTKGVSERQAAHEPLAPMYSTSSSMSVAPPATPAQQAATLDKALYTLHKGIAAGYPQTLSELTALAEQGNQRALLYAAGMYQRGLGCPKNEAKALNYCLAAAEQGNALAAFNAGVMLRQSDSLPPDFEQSTKWLKKAVEQGNTNALYMLGDAHFKGLGTAQSYQHAVAAFEQSDDPNATFMLAYCYLNGYGVERNTDKAKELVKQTAKRGSRRALDFMLAIRDPEQYTEATTTMQGKPKPMAKHTPDVEKWIPKKYAAVGNSALTDGLSGTWSGALVTYDYGKNEVVNNEAFSLELTLNGSELYGVWKDPKREPFALRATYADSVWVFAKGLVRKSEPLQTLQTVRLQYEKDGGNEFITGNLQMLLMEFREYELPTMLVLAKATPATTPEVTVAANNEMRQPQNAIRAYPNPFGPTLNVELQLEQTCKLSISLYTASGAQVYSLPNREYPAGISVESITASLPSGVYLVRVEGDAHLAAWVVKK